MTNGPTWLPSLMKLDESGGNWQCYIDAVYSVFYRDFIQTHPMFRTRHVACRHDPICDGKEAGFWHCTSTGADESNRTPDLRRCERIGWVRALIEHENDNSVDVWIRDSGRKGRSVQVWFNEEYLVVLGIRKNCYLLVTGYCTDRNHTIRKMRKERNNYIKKLTPPPKDDVDTPSTRGRRAIGIIGFLAPKSKRIYNFLPQKYLYAIRHLGFTGQTILLTSKERHGWH